jgi:3-phenylpropionate/trans-cinnamate dioxygenase ferredoxin reductase component
LRSASYYADLDIQLRLGVPVVTVDAVGQCVRLATGERVAYTAAVIASGVAARQLPSWREVSCVHVIRTLEDSVGLRAAARLATSGVVIGAGFLGCEVASSLVDLGLMVTLVDPLAQPLAAVLGCDIGRRISALHNAAGVDVRTGVGVDSIDDRNGSARVILTDGTRLSADLIVVAIEAVPNVSMLHGSGVLVSGGVLCDEWGRTSVSGVWAVGDVARWWHHPSHSYERVEHWTNAQEQGTAVGGAIARGVVQRGGASVPYLWSDQYNLKIQVFGRPAPEDQVEFFELDRGAAHRWAALHSREGYLAAASGLGAAAALVRLRNLLERRADPEQARLLLRSLL